MSHSGRGRAAAGAERYVPTSVRMATREFTDSEGIVWRAWDVRPSLVHRLGDQSDYIASWGGGWLAFESATEKRRLASPYPARWREYDLQKLEMLLRAATRVGAKRAASPTSVELVRIESDAREEEWSRAERTFTSPRGRLWTVRLHDRPGPHHEDTTVLRFTAGDSVVDLVDWPAEWMQLSREDYAMLLLDAEPPRRKGRGADPQRRREDRPED